MNLELDPRVKETTKKLSQDDLGRISRYVDLFDNYGFSLTSKYLKKLDRNLWELRPGNIRVLLGWSTDKKSLIVVNIFKKKSQKTLINDLQTAINRLKEY